MTTIISITAEPVTDMQGVVYDYSKEDRILKNVMTNDYEVYYSGQNQGRSDYKLIESVYNHEEFRIYYRKRANTQFTYLGLATSSSVIRERFAQTGFDSSPNERLQIRLVVTAENVINQQVVSPPEFENYGKYKKAILQHSNFQINGQNLNVGFYKQ
jgi:hypothetical protein